jgi:hypothetical protein
MHTDRLALCRQAFQLIRIGRRECEGRHRHATLNVTSGADMCESIVVSSYRSQQEADGATPGGLSGSSATAGSGWPILGDTTIALHTVRDHCDLAGQRPCGRALSSSSELNISTSPSTPVDGVAGNPPSAAATSHCG